MNYLFNEHPIVIDKDIAVVIGLNEAIILQQMQYWIKKSNKIIDGKSWIYNSVTEWKKQFPFFSDSTITRAIKKLEDRKIVSVGNYNKNGMDRTKWYSINYETLNNLMTNAFSQNDECIQSNCTNASSQNDQMHLVKLTRPIPEITTEITTEITNNIIKQKSRTAKSNQFPSNFTIKESHQVLAKKLGIHLDNEFEHFRDHHLAKGSTMKSWDAALNLWLRNAAKFAKTKQTYKTRSERNMELLKKSTEFKSPFDFDDDVIEHVINSE